MTDPIDPMQQNLLSRLGGLQGTGPASGETRSKPTQESNAPAFHALLEKLQAKAQELETARESVERPEDLAKAVDRAQDSLEAALSFGDQLLEAYRERLHRPEGSAGGDAGGGTGQ